MQDLLSILMKIRSSELDYNLSIFIATAGLIVASCDGGINQDESECILDNLSQLQIFPKQFIDDLTKQDVPTLFQESLKKILEINPTLRDNMLTYIMGIIISDKKFTEAEIDLLNNIGENMLGYSKKEIAHYFASAIQEDFSPSYEGLK